MLNIEMVSIWGQNKKEYKSMNYTDYQILDCLKTNVSNCLGKSYFHYGAAFSLVVTIVNPFAYWWLQGQRAYH